MRWLLHARFECGSRESPGERVTFFCFAKRKSPKKRRPPVCDPCASLRGKPASGRLRGAPWNSLRCVAASFRQPRRVSSRSTRAPTHVPPHNRPAAGASSRGWTAEHPNSQHPFGPSLRSAQLAQRVALAPAKRGRAQRSEAMARVDVPRVPFCACREAQGRGCVRVPKDTRTSCTDLPQLFERSASARSEFCGAPSVRASQVARSAAKGRSQ